MVKLSELNNEDFVINTNHDFAETKKDVMALYNCNEIKEDDSLYLAIHPRYYNRDMYFCKGEKIKIDVMW